MGEDGVKAFERFANEQNFVRDLSPSWSSGFKKKATLPRLGEHSERVGGEGVKEPAVEVHKSRERSRRDDRSDRSRARGRRREPGEHHRRRKRRSSRHHEEFERDKVTRFTGGTHEDDRRTDPPVDVRVKVEKQDSDSDGGSAGHGLGPPLEDSEMTSFRGSASSRLSEGRESFHPSRIAPALPVGNWKKPAALPQSPGSRRQDVAPEVRRGETPKAAFGRDAFEKVAEVPRFPPSAREELVAVRCPLPVAGATARGSKDKEEKSLHQFDERCLSLYTELLDLNQDMEISEILRNLSDEKYGEAFAELTRPKRAATGLMYLRMMESYLVWYKAQRGESGERILHPPAHRDIFWLYLHHIKSERKGKYSPKTAYLALKYFADCFGFSDEAVTYRRAKKLVEMSSKPEGPRNQADMIPVATLDYLESAVGDPTLAKGVRVAAGKLRLCCQASMRWDDLARTPMGHLEWVRRRGSPKVVGIRSLDAQSKTGVRPWVASYLGVTEHSDDWLAILVQLLLEIHGAAWQSHDHTGKSFSTDGKSAGVGVASFAQDVSFVRALMLDAIDRGLEVGLDRVQASNLRWHGAKATLTSFMMHCKISPRAVRFAGNWKDQRETMPDTYLREAQLLVLDAQETVLNYIRGGGFVATLEGLPLCPDVSLGSDVVSKPEYQLALEDMKRIREAAPTPPGLDTRDVARAVLDKAASNGEGLTVEALRDEEKAEVIETKALEDLLDEVVCPVGGEDKAPGDESSGEESSADEFYENCYLQVPQSLRGSLHKPSVAEPGLPRCGTRARGFTALSVEEKISKKTTFCAKCFGKCKDGGCDKICSKTKMIKVDGAPVVFRCSRRCALECEKLAGYLDVDDRPHLCSVHLEAAGSSDNEEIHDLGEEGEVGGGGALRRDWPADERVAGRKEGDRTSVDSKDL